MIFRRPMLKINTFNKLLAERSLDSHMLWKGALRWDLNNVKKAFHLNDNQLIMIIVSVGSREGAREAPAPLSQGLDDPPLPPPLLCQGLDPAFSVGGRKGGKNDPRTIGRHYSEKKGTRWVMRTKQEDTSRKRSSLLYSCASFLFLNAVHFYWTGSSSLSTLKC